MLSTLAPAPARNTSLWVNRPRRPPGASVILAIVSALLVAIGSTTVSTLAYLEVPAPTGSNAVGRVDTLLTDSSRTDVVNGGPRHVRVIAWYPASKGSGMPSGYVPGYDAVRQGLEASGELSPLVVAGLGFVRDGARENGVLAADGRKLPVIVLEPGNATNVAFYGSLAEDLASHGYAVIGIDHPYQVAAVDLGDGHVAVYHGDAPTGGLTADITRKVDERLADIGFVLDRLDVDAAGLRPLAGQIELGRVGIVGHSNGGIAAAEACEAMARVSACVNIDGQSAGGPFSAAANPSAPSKAFLYLTKETEIHPVLGALFEAGGADTYRVVIPAASHDDFTDGPHFGPRLVPVDSTADAVLTVARGFTLAFFDHELRGAPQSVFSTVRAPTDVQVSVYPLGGNATSRAATP